MAIVFPWIVENTFKQWPTVRIFQPSSTGVSDWTEVLGRLLCYYSLLYITAYYCIPEGSSLILKPMETYTHLICMGLLCPSIWTVNVKSSFNWPYQLFEPGPCWASEDKSSRLEWLTWARERPVAMSVSPRGVSRISACHFWKCLRLWA